jgi:hypothetical protein
MPPRASTRPTTPPEERLPGWLAPALYAIVTLILFREFIFGLKEILGTDTIALGYFARNFYTHFLRDLGTFPVWNPLLFGGLPFVDGMHGDIFYPVSLLLTFLDPARSWGWKLVLHVFLAGCFTYLWLRGIAVGRGSALFGGLVYMLGAHLISLVYPGHDGKLFVAALTPLVFWLAERAVTRRGIPEFAFFALGVTMLLLTAHMQLAYFAVWGVTLYFGFRLVQLWRQERRPGTIARLFGLFALAGLAGTAAAAVQLVPPYLYLNEWSHRVEKTVEAEAERGYEYATSWSLHPEEAVGLVVPEFAGDNISTADGRQNNTYWGRNPFKLNAEYAGLVPLLLVPLLFLRRRDPRAWFFAGLGVLSLLFALGATTPVFRIFYHLVPGVKLFRAPSTIVFLLGLSVATLGALGLERFLEGVGMGAGEGAEEGRRVRRYLWGATAALALLALLASSGALLDLWRAVFYPGIEPHKEAALAANLPAIRTGFGIAFLLALVVAATWEARARGIVGRQVALAALVILAALDLWRVDRDFVTGTVALNEIGVDPALYQADPTIHFLQSRQGAGEVFRVLDLGAYGTNVLAVHGLEQVAGHHGNELGRYRALVGGDQVANVAASELRLLDLVNATYLVSPQPIEAPGFTEVFRGNRSLVYRNDNALPRAFLVGETEVVADDDAVARILGRDFDFRSTAALAEPLPEGVRLEAGPMGEVEWTAREHDRASLRVRTDRPALLVVTENFYPAWHAAVDGAPAPVLRADYAFRAIPVPAGEHEVTLTYHSRVLNASAAVSAGTIALLLGLGIGGSIIRRRREPHPGDD